MPTERKVPRRSSAGALSRERLLDTAEALLAEHGIDGVSLRQIAAATGQANNSVVQYHFGDKAGLIRELIARRVAGFEPRRVALLNDATAGTARPDIARLLEVIFRPLAEATDSEGRHIYARFMNEFLTRFQYQPGIEHPGWAPDSAGTRAATLIGTLLPELSPHDLTTRLNRIAGLFLSALIDRDNALANGREVEPSKHFFSDLFAMMAAAVAAKR